MLPADHDKIAMTSLSKMSLWACASFAASATLRRMFQYVEAWGVLHVV